MINISGLAALSTGSTIGSMRNVGVAALTKNLADELAPSGISVVCVHPGRTRTIVDCELPLRDRPNVPWGEWSVSCHLPALPRRDTAAV
jgi:NAD(P)-dependent dehydrogenase (short-subunit alcohol dehydrogenase family)